MEFFGLTAAEAIVVLLGVLLTIGLVTLVI